MQPDSLDFEKFDQHLEANAHDSATRQTHQAIATRIPGWSGHLHLAFFKSIFAAFPIERVLIVGVYLGRDITLMLAGSNRPMQIVGVDKFSDTPCDDWPEEKRGMTWQQAGFGEAPSLEKAAANINAQPPHAVRLIQSNDADWLPMVEGQFDLIYLDTAHDKATVVRQLQQIRKLCHPGTIIAGDDYENILPTWGVKDAVTECFTEHAFMPSASIWYARARDLK